MVTVKNISDFIDSFAPYNTKCSWDNCGILVGDSDKKIEKIGFALDLTPETLDEAIKNRVDLVITHHPIIFHPQKSFLNGDMPYELAKNNISAISAHTCFDCADGGVNDVLCDILNIKNPVGVGSDECAVPMVRIGEIEPMQSEEFAKFVAEKLGTTVRFIDCENRIENVAVCGGAGMDFIDDVISAGADAYVTGDISHHEMLDAKNKGISVVAAGHFETENPSMTALMNRIKNQFATLEVIKLKQSNPIKFIG